MLAKDAEAVLGEPVVIVNVPGAGGTIGVDQRVRSKPDGQTVAGVWLGPIKVSPNTMKVNYTPNDYIAVMQVSSAPYVMCVHPGVHIVGAVELRERRLERVVAPAEVADATSKGSCAGATSGETRWTGRRVKDSALGRAGVTDRV